MYFLLVSGYKKCNSIEGECLFMATSCTLDAELFDKNYEIFLSSIDL
ncbi:hypothetical protein HMPREF3034_01017 [Prevotella sp. DNF00663]|nr:hypothetical protein HMPREF3034_01017 [Prevotella sp. DNF00663]